MARGKTPIGGRWSLLQSPPRNLTRREQSSWKRNRGFELERLLVDLARQERLEAGPPFRGNGEQIDGYFVVDHRHFLLEAKWQELPVSASDVYAFQGKLRGKLLGTLGLFVSISGFAADVPSALRFGKEINVLLADRSDIQLAIEPGRTFQEMVRVKIRAAAQRADVYYTYQRWLDANP